MILLEKICPYIKWLIWTWLENESIVRQNLNVHIENGRVSSDARPRAAHLVTVRPSGEDTLPSN